MLHEISHNAYNEKKLTRESTARLNKLPVEGPLHITSTKQCMQSLIKNSKLSIAYILCCVLV